MCTVSMIGDSFRDTFPQKYPWYQPPPNPNPWNNFVVNPTREEFDNLKKEVEALKELLKAAKIYDEATNQKDCEMDEKIALLRKIAELVGVDLDDVFPTTKNP